MAEEVAPDPTVSLTFRDVDTGKNILRIVAVVTPEDHIKIEADKSGELLTKYVISQVLHHFKIKHVAVEGAAEPAKA